jgi:uncharacterized protein (DUF952 family)
MTETFHLTPRETWEEQANSSTYVPEPFEREGFIHCTDGERNVVDVGNRYYRADGRPFVCLVIDLDKVDAKIKYEDEARIYPHIYGPLNTTSVHRVRSVQRDANGTFLALGD